jgi:hypothetical protein
MTGLKCVIIGTGTQAGLLAHYGARDLSPNWEAVVLGAGAMFLVVLGVWLRDGWVVERRPAPTGS